MFRRLFWKEWRENLWKLVLGGAVSLAFTALLFRIRLFPDSVNCIWISFVQMLAIPVIYALDIFSGEMSNRTIHLLFKFPVPRWKIFFSKYLVSICGMINIFLASGLLMELMSQGRETETGFLLKMNALFGVAACFYLHGFADSAPKAIVRLGRWWRCSASSLDGGLSCSGRYSVTINGPCILYHIILFCFSFPMNRTPSIS